MSQEDAEIVQQIFERTDEPLFTIIKRENVPNTDLCEVEFSFLSSHSLWHLAKTVQMEITHNNQIKEAIQNARKQMDDKIKELKDKYYEP